jgi:pimeloyl-ACP methyl ester carboxylesterase
MKTAFVKTIDGLQLHYATSEGWDASLTPVIFVPGMLGILDFYERELNEFSPRRVLTFSHRGLGQSEAVSPGFASFKSRCKDIQAVTSVLDGAPYFLCGFSRGVALCIEHALSFPERVKGMILIDCDAKYFKPNQAWLDHFKTHRHPQFHMPTLIRYAEDAENVDLTQRLNEIKSPVLILRGGQPGSLLPMEMASEMQKMIKGSNVSVLANSDHEVSDQDFTVYIKTISAFLNQHG